MDCLLETKVDVTLEGETGVDSGCKYDCRGQIIISVGSGVLVGALLVVVGRWAIRYMVMGIVYFFLFFNSVEFTSICFSMVSGCEMVLIILFLICQDDIQRSHEKWNMYPSLCPNLKC